MSAGIDVHDQILRGRDVRWIELNRAAKSNALSVAMLQAATQAVAAIPNRAIFISARGQTFSAGLDLREILRFGSAERPLRALRALYDALLKHPSPTACLVEHKAMAGGVGLALCADALVLGGDAWFGLPSERVYRPLAEVLLPVARARRGISEREFAHWFDAPVSAAELAASGRIDRIVQRRGSRSMTSDLKRAAVAVLVKKGLYSACDLADRIDATVRAEQERRAEKAIAASRTRPFRMAVQRRLDGGVAPRLGT